MSFHPHLHAILSTGGWSDKKQTWIEAKHVKHGFFIPQKVVAACFKKHFLYAFSQLWEQGHLLLPKELMHLNNPDDFRLFYAQIAFKKNWIVKIMPSLDNPKRVIDYLGRYVYRIAITDSRIKDIKKEERKVTFEYKDYAAKTADNQPTPIKTMTLDAIEFIRRFAQHVLPQGFQKIRYYGIYATACRKNNRLKIDQTLTNKNWTTTIRTVCQIIIAATGINPNVCSACGEEKLIVLIIPPTGPLSIKAQNDELIKLSRPPPTI
jgi:hypothetical protein